MAGTYNTQPVQMGYRALADTSAQQGDITGLGRSSGAGFGAPSAAAVDQANAQNSLGRQAYNPAAMGLANGDRASQSQALAMAANAAAGNAPSQAQIQGQQAIGASIQNQLAANANSNGLMGQAAAMRASQMGAANSQQGAVAGVAAGRAAEMASARDQYGQGAGALRGADLQSAQQMSQNEYQQRQMNADAALKYSQLGQQAYNRQSQMDLGTGQINAQNWQNYTKNQGDFYRHEQQMAQDSYDRTAKNGAAGLGALTSMMSMAMSDSRSKRDIVPLSMGEAAVNCRTYGAGK